MELLKERADREKNHKSPSTLQRRCRTVEDQPSAKGQVDAEAFEKCKLELQSCKEENQQLRLELESARQMSVAARLAEDELPKVLEHCARQENLLMQLGQQFKLVQAQVEEKSKALKELQAESAGAATVGDKKRVEEIPDDACCDAFDTLGALSSANTTLRTSLKNFTQARQWDSTNTSAGATWGAGQSARATWGGGTAWTNFSSSNRHRKLNSQNRMSRSQVSFASFHEEVR